MSGRRRHRSAGRMSVSIIVLAFLVIITIQIVQLKKTDQSYAAQETKLENQIAEETKRSEELLDLEEYMQTLDYVEDTAKTKLGLVYDNEIIYKESK